MKYAIDRIENNIAILENIDTKKMINIDIDNLPSDIHEGSILVYSNNQFIIDKKLEDDRRKSIQEKFNRLRKTS
jgi:hypothetical protein